MDRDDAAVGRLRELLERGGAAFAIHVHPAARTMEDARVGLAFDLERIVKTVAFGLRAGGLVLAALRGLRRVDYPRLAALVGVNRRELRPLSPEEVYVRLGVEPGGVSLLPPHPGAAAFLDQDALTIRPTLYCGAGRPDRTLELSPNDLLRLGAARVGAFSR
ncbi:YbaK/EbsC family protein [Desulfovibrio aminophilus]|uniref:aminoacyl-tRNA deacylase n=1 Tax=Desulfovibrio aminophilus TaxID=81425 RepID=UPI003391A53A